MKTFFYYFSFMLALCATAFAQSDAGRIVVTVSDSGSGQYLQSARVELVGQNREAGSDVYGIAEFTGLPAGDYTVRVTYAGSKDFSATVTVAPGATASVAASMASSEVVQLDRFVIETERSGNAAAINRQKNALNVENVIAMDALGRLANDNPSELLTRLPGITSGFSTEGNADQIMVRGMSSEQSGVTIDGSDLTSGNSMSRAVMFTSIAASNFDEIQVSKAPTPNMAADRLGGRINFKTKPAFDIKGKRGASFNVGGKWSPSFFDYSPRRKSPSLTPNLSASWRESFSVFGGKRNLGVSFNASYNENITQSVRTIARLDQNNPDPLFTYALERRDRVVDRTSLSGSLRLDYKFNPDHILNFTYNINTLRQYGESPGKFIYDTRLTMNSRNRAFEDVSAADGAIRVGSTEDYTMVRARANTRLEIEVDPSGAKDMTNFFKLGGEHRLGNWKADWSASYSTSTREQNPQGAKYNYAGHRLLATMSNIGWTVDKRGSVDFPAAVQHPGDARSIFDVTNYTAATLYNDIIDATNDATVGAVNLSRDIVVFGQPLKFSTGGRYLSRSFEQKNYTASYKYVGENGTVNLSRFVSDFDADARLGLGNLPVFDPSKYARSFYEESTLWEGNPFNVEASRRSGEQYVEENVYAAYAMGAMSLGRLTVLGGVRFEKTDSIARGYRKNSTEDSSTYTSMDDVNKAYHGRLQYDRSYDDFFPGVHLRYRITPNLQARASLHTTIGRPDLTDLLPGFSVNTSEERVTINNPDIKPQYAFNYDLSLEYYFKPMGMFTVGVFRKDLTDFIYSGLIGQVEADVDYGFDSTSYIGYDLYTIKNGSKGKVDGIEIAFSQQFTFLPGVLRGLALTANYTKLKASGDYGDGNQFSLPGFIPETANARLSYTYHPVSVYVQWSYRSDTMAAYSVNWWQRTITVKRSMINVGMSLKLPRNFEVYFDINNITDEPGLSERYKVGTRISTNYNGPFVTCGFGGRF